MRAVRIIDGRGRRVPLCTPRDLPPSATSAARHSVGSANAHRLGRLVIVLVSVTAANATLLVLRSGGPGNPPLSAHLVGWVAGLIASAAIVVPVAWVYSVRRGARLASAACLADSICPSCAYSLAGLPREADGCLVCPECASAWRRGGKGER